MTQRSEANIWRALEVFQTICQCGGFSAAQDVLSLSQSTVSNHVANLEQHFGYSLCVRGRKGFQLTERGKAMMKSYSKLELSIDSFNEEVHDLKNETHGILRVGILDHTLTENLFSTVNVIRQFTQAAPSAELHLVQDTQFNLHNAIVDEKIDLGVGVHVASSKLVRATVLYDELHHLYCGAEHPFFELPSSRLTQVTLEEADWVTNGYPHGIFSMQPFPNVKSSVIATNVESIAMTVLAGKHIGYLPSHYASKYESSSLLQRLLPSEFARETEISVISKTGRRQSYAMRQFQKICLEQAQNDPC